VNIVCPLNVTVSVALVTVPDPTIGVHDELGQEWLVFTVLGSIVADNEPTVAFPFWAVNPCAPELPVATVF
jgi:hypothetical protein